MIPATVAAPLYFRPIGTDLYEVVRHGQAAGRVRWTGTGFDSYTLTGELIAADAAVMTEAADRLEVTVEPELAPTRITPAAVSGVLRRAGFAPVAPSDHNREGLKVKASGTEVRVVADLDAPRAAVRMATDARDALEALGYVVTAVSPAAGFHVRGRRA